jgi:HK97 gp10 family phage protein
MVFHVKRGVGDVPAFPEGDRLVWETGALERLLNGVDGPVAGDLLRRAIRVEAAAKNFATGNAGGPHVRTGRLRSSISHAIGKDEAGLYADIGSNVEYAGFLELGTRRMRPYPFLRPALPAAVN